MSATQERSSLTARPSSPEDLQPAHRRAGAVTIPSTGARKRHDSRTVVVGPGTVPGTVPGAAPGTTRDPGSGPPLRSAAPAEPDVSEEGEHQQDDRDDRDQ